MSEGARSGSAGSELGEGAPDDPDGPNQPGASCDEEDDSAESDWEVRWLERGAHDCAWATLCT